MGGIFFHLESVYTKNKFRIIFLFHSLNGKVGKNDDSFFMFDKIIT